MSLIRGLHSPRTGLLLYLNRLSVAGKEGNSSVERSRLFSTYSSNTWAARGFTFNKISLLIMHARQVRRVREGFQGHKAFSKDSS